MNDKIHKETKADNKFECPVSYLLSDIYGEDITSGEAIARLTEEGISIIQARKEVLHLQYRDIIKVYRQDYKAKLTCTSGETLSLFNLEYRYDDFLRVLSGLRNEVLLKDLLVNENLKMPGIAGQVTFINDEGKEHIIGKSEIRIYDSSVVILPGTGEIVRLSYGEIFEFKSKGCKLSIFTDWGEKYIFSMLGQQFDLLLQELSRAMEELYFKVQCTLGELLPGISPTVIRKASRLMKEGKAVKRSEIEGVSPNLWSELEKKLAQTGIKEKYNFLTSIAQENEIYAGIKKGLMGKIGGGEYIWLLIPIYSTNHSEPGNAIAMEAVSGKGGSKATYFFRIVSRSDYAFYQCPQNLESAVETFVKYVNRCMQAINFRREPVYLPEERLREPRYRKYREALQQIPSLRILRDLFIGRVIYSSNKQWQEEVMDLLRFNVSQIDDNVKWTKRK